MKVSSSQVVAGASGAAIGGIAVAALAENLTAMKVVGGATLLGVIAVFLSKALKK